MKGRTKNSFFNACSSSLIMITKTLLGFVTRTIFIKTLGETSLGINGLFVNILSMLSLAELGIGTAMSFSLYKPLSEKDEKKVSILMSFYKKTYKLIGAIVFIVGILLMPFLNLFIRDIKNIDNVYLIYFLYLLNTASFYFIAYKETLIIADQKEYELTKVNIFAIIGINLFQILFLYITRNFIVYLLVQFFIQLIQRVVINGYISKRYKNINFNDKNKIEENDKKEIKKNVKAMFFHKIGEYCVNGTDNIILSSFVGITSVGLYSNYVMIINALNGLISKIFNSIVSSVGNLAITNENEKKEKVFNVLNFLAFVLYGGCSICLLNVLPYFIMLWIGKKYCLTFLTTIVIVLVFFITGLGVPANSFKYAAGLYDVDKRTPIIQSIINLLVSILLVSKMGILGVLLGTLISFLVLPCWQRPVLLYKYVLNKSPKQYFIRYVRNIFIVFFCAIISLVITRAINIENLIATTFINGFISLLLFVIAIVIICRKEEEFKFIIKLVKVVRK